MDLEMWAETGCGGFDDGGGDGNGGHHYLKSAEVF